MTIESYFESSEPNVTGWGDAEINGGHMLGDDRIETGGYGRMQRVYQTAIDVLKGAHFEVERGDVGIRQAGRIVRRVTALRHRPTGIQRWVVIQPNDFQDGGRLP